MSNARNLANLLSASGDANFTGEIQLNTSAGTSGQLLTSQGAGVDPVWADAPVSLPDQTGNSGYYLTTNGTAASWAALTGSVDGGGASSVYLVSQNLDGGSANG